MPPIRQRMVMIDSEKASALEFIIDECHSNLSNDDAVYEYLSRTRKLTDETIRRFRLGAFPKNLKNIVNNVDTEILKQLKIAWVSSFDGNGICKFREHYRFVAPIYDAYGSPLGIMGRFLGTEAERETLGIHKYDNSDYPKHTTLYGLHLAKNNIRAKNKALVVEGVLDVIKCHQHGIDTAVATAGAFVKLEHLAQLARYTSEIYLGFDNDEAGTKALARAMELKRPGINLFEKRAPAKFKDIDEFLDQKHSK
jgi:DNA primase